MSSSPDPRTRSPATLPLWLIAMALLLIAVLLGVNLFRYPEHRNMARDEALPRGGQGIAGPVATAMTAAEFKERLATNRSRRKTSADTARAETGGSPMNAGLEPVPDQVAVAPINPTPAVILPNPAALGAVAAGNLDGVVFGKVTLVGTPPPEILVDMSPDPRCAAAHSEPVTTRHYVVSPDGGLADVLVYITRGLEGQTFAVPTDTPVMDQVGCEFQPYVMGVQVNQRLLIRNSDPTLHSIRATARLNPVFNLSEPSQGQVIERSFSQPEVFIRFKCDVHPWMFAYVAVLPHPFFAVTGRDGTFRFPPGLPPGHYTVEANHLKAGKTTRYVTVAKGRPSRLDFRLQVPQ